MILQLLDRPIDRRIAQQIQRATNKDYIRALEEAVAQYSAYGEWSHPPMAKSHPVVHMSPFVFFEGADMRQKLDMYQFVTNQLLYSGPPFGFHPLEFGAKRWYPDKVKVAYIETSNGARTS